MSLDLEAIFNKMFNDVLQYIPEGERPDMSTVTQFFVETFGKVQIENGRKCYPGFSVKMAEWVHDNWTPWKDDVIIASFPKTGTTWTREIVTRIIYKDDEKIREMVSKMTMPQLYLETGLPKKFEMLDRLPWKRRVLSTHLPADLVNTERIRKAGAKMIYTIRNPKDTMVSFFKMDKKFITGPEARMQEYVDDWNGYVEMFVSGKRPTLMKDGEWIPDHVIGWNKNKDDGNILFVVFEDMKKNPRKGIDRIAKFLEVDLTEQELDKIMEATSFKSMKENASDILKQMNFFAKGEVGNWKNHFTVAQSELIDRKLAEKLASTDITFTYQLPK